ncbi:MAG: hypothetical protein CMD18_02855 [Flavobacteriales bacterium]|nr:hypothetical protein [Flavobacteriales bacterium]|tara:strand:+ start:197 stop:1030 length:834 start_codon:yes stop_codon:yes gene_type:complete
MKKVIIFFSGLFFLFSCGSSDEENIPQEEIDKVIAISNYSPIILERGGLKLIEFNDFPPFNDVETKIATQNQTFKMGSNKIEFKNKFFNLGEKTVEEKIHRARLNEGGQYLGVLSLNKPLKKVIQGHFETEVEKGNNLFFCYLSRSYDLSVKNKNASFLFKINADPSGCFSETELSDTVIALLQPRGIYSPNKDEDILFDFFLKNISLSDGDYISLKIDEVEFKLTKWVPFWIQGLKSGNHKIAIEFKTKENKSIKGIMPNQLSTIISVKEVNLFSE